VFGDFALLVTDDGQVCHLRHKDGTQVWRSAVGPSTQCTSAVDQAGGRAYLGIANGEDGGRIEAISLANGEHIWSAPMAVPVTAGPVHDPACGMVICGHDAGAICAVDAETGHARWQLECRGSPRANIVVDDSHRCYFGTTLGNLICCDAANGSVIWERKIADRLVCGLLLTDELVIAGGSTHVCALQRETGRVKWWSAIPSRAVGFDLAPDGQTAAVACSEGAVLLLEVSDGHCTGINQTGGRLESAPCLLEQTLVIVASNDVLCSYALS
jgi:outer membrane protein assembly factor BamB